MAVAFADGSYTELPTARASDKVQYHSPLALSLVVSASPAAKARVDPKHRVVSAGALHLGAGDGVLNLAVVACITCILARLVTGVIARVRATGREQNESCQCYPHGHIVARYSLDQGAEAISLATGVTGKR